MRSSLGDIIKGMVLGEWWDFAEGIGLPSWLRGHLPSHTPDFIIDAGWDWYYRGICKGGSPSGMCLWVWKDSVRTTFTLWLTNKITGATDTLKSWVSAITGRVPSGWSNLGHAIQVAWEWIGTHKPSFAATLGAGLFWLYDRLPASVRLGLKSWWELFEDIKDVVRTWVKDYVSPTINLVNILREWVNDKGFGVYNWYQGVRSFIGNLINQPFVTLLSLLGVSGDTWSTFWSDPLDYILRKWGLSRQDVYEFFDHPVIWLLDKLVEEMTKPGSGIAWDFVKLVGKIIEKTWEV
jgi:hypothetical protein